MTSLARLAPGRARMLALFDDGPEEDSVGIELGEPKGWQFAAIDALIAKGLVKPHSGWRWTFWFRLTPEGRRIRVEYQR